MGWAEDDRAERRRSDRLSRSGRRPAGPARRRMHIRIGTTSSCSRRTMFWLERSPNSPLKRWRGPRLVPTCWKRLRSIKRPSLLTMTRITQSPVRTSTTGSISRRATRRHSGKSSRSTWRARPGSQLSMFRWSMGTYPEGTDFSYARVPAFDQEALVLVTHGPEGEKKLSMVELDATAKGKIPPRPKGS